MAAEEGLGSIGVREGRRGDAPSTETWKEWCSPRSGENVTFESSNNSEPISTGWANCNSLRVGKRNQSVSQPKRKLDGPDALESDEGHG